MSKVVIPEIANITMLPIPELTNTDSLTIEIILGIIIAIGISVYFDKKQAKISNEIVKLTREQTKLIEIIEERRKDRIRWFKHVSLLLLKSIKDEYRKLSKAVDEYDSTDDEKISEKIKISAEFALKILVSTSYEVIVKYDLPTVQEYIKNTRLVAKLGDYLSPIGWGFSAATREPIDTENIREQIKLSVTALDDVINDISAEED